MFRKPPFAQERGERPELRRRLLLPLPPGLQDRADPFAEAFVRVAHHRRRANAGEGGEGVLHGDRGEVHPAPDDEVLHPAGDPDVPLAVDAGEVSGAEEPVRGQQRFVQGLLGVVADEHPRPAHRKLALRTRRGRLAARVEGAELEPGKPDPGGGQHLLAGARGGAGREPALGHAPEHGGPGVRELDLRLLHERRRDLGAAAEEPGERRELRRAAGGGRPSGGRCRPGRVHQVLKERGRGGREAAPVGGDRIERAGGIPPVLEDERCAGVEREAGAVDHPDAVPERRRHEDRRVGSEPEPLRERDVEGGERVAGVHHRLRRAGGAGGEHEVVESRRGRRGGSGVVAGVGAVVAVASDVPGAFVAPRIRARARRPPAPDTVLGDDRHRRRDGTPRRGFEGERPGLGPAVPLDGEERAGSTERRRVAKGVLVGPDREVGGNRAVPERGEHRRQRLDPVRHEDEDDVPRADPLRGEVRSEPARFPPELPAGEAAPPVVEDGGRVRLVPDEAVEALRERRARPPAAFAVAPRPLRAPGVPHGSRSDPTACPIELRPPLAPNPAESRHTAQRSGPSALKRDEPLLIPGAFLFLIRGGPVMPRPAAPRCGCRPRH